MPVEKPPVQVTGQARAVLCHFIDDMVRVGNVTERVKSHQNG
jgi:hypothetical protein